MKTNSLLTYLLYALLAALIIAAGFKACQMQKEKQAKEQEQKEWEETRRKLYPETDSTAGGSTYINRDSTYQTTTGTKHTTPAENKPGAAVKTKPVTTTPSTGTPSTTKPKTSTKTVKGAGAGRYTVQAGAFSNIEGARERLEAVIRMGYPNAEIGKSGRYHVVVVMRTNDKAKAIQVNDQLERRGMDAMVRDANRKN